MMKIVNTVWWNSFEILKECFGNSYGILMTFLGNYFEIIRKSNYYKIIKQLLRQSYKIHGNLFEIHKHSLIISQDFDEIHDNFKRISYDFVIIS